MQISFNAFCIIVCAISTRNSVYFWKAQLERCAGDVQTASLFSAEILHGAKQHPINLKNAPSLLRGIFKATKKAFRGHCIECHVAFSRILSKFETHALIHSAEETSRVTTARSAWSSLVHALSQD